MSVPSDVREQLRQELSKRADALDWAHLSPADKARYYEHWTEDDQIGGLLSHYIDKGRVHVYLKDTLLKGYARQQQSDDALIRRVLGIPPDIDTRRAYTKPHGRYLADDRVFCWGRASHWKLILMALYERTYESTVAQPYAAILYEAAGRYSEAGVRRMIEDAATRLDIEVIKWL